jgi:hypothetical protein
MLRYNYIITKKKVNTMKIKYIPLLEILLLILTLSFFGFISHKDDAKKKMSKPDMWSVMGKPSYESTVDSLNTKVWILTQAKHRKLLSGKMGDMMHSEKTSLDNHPTSARMNDSTMGMDKASRKAMMTGTHFMMIDVTNTISGKEITNGSAKVQIVYPSRKSVAVELKIIMSHFGSALTLKEKGKYLFTINVDFGGGYKTTQFKYVVR